MAKAITCGSRDALAVWTARANSDQYYSSSHNGHGEAGRAVAQKILNNHKAWQDSETEPIFIEENEEWRTDSGLVCGYPVKFWLYKNRIFNEAERVNYTLEQRKLLVLEEFDKERKQFEKLHAKFSGTPSTSQSRSKIPSHVRIFVWQRDSGKCVECGSNENLEYDHIIPFAKGGSNTERNLQLLCGNCNRLKSDNIQ